MRNAVQQWMAETLDLGLLPEAEMHRLAGDMPPRQFALEHPELFARMAKLSFEALDPNSGLSTDELIKLSSDPAERQFDSGQCEDWRFDPSTRACRRHCKLAADDQSPSVAIAACDGLLRSTDTASREDAVVRLIELANVENSGHFAAIAAMNVLDMNAKLSERRQVQDQGRCHANSNDHQPESASTSAS